MRRFAVLLGVVALSACGGGGSAVSPGAGAGASSSAQSVPVTFTIVIPGKTASSMSRHLQYISASTASASVSVNAGAPTTAPCSTTCTLTVNAPVGNDTFAVSLYDASNNLLSQGSAGATISGTIANTVNIAFGGAVASIVLASSVAHLVPGTLSTNATITITAKDADGNTIVGTDPYVHPITLTDSDGSGATSLSSTSITSPATGSVTFSYSGAGAIAGTTVTITPSATGASGNTAASMQVYAHHSFIEYALSGTYPDTLATGSDGNVWFGYQNSSLVGYITPSGSISQFATDGGLSQMVEAGDGNIWFTEFSVNEIGRVTPAGVVTNYTGITGIEPFGITVGSNGSLYFVTFGNGSSGGGYAGQITTGGSLSASSQLAGPPQLQGVASGSDGRLWMTEPFSGGTEYLDAMTTGFSFTRYSIPSGAQLREVIAGPNNDLWINDTGNQKMDEVNTSGSFVHQYPEASAYPQGLAVGSDGNLYYGGDGSNVLGVMTTGGSETDYAIPTANCNVSAITSGPDGNIWFTEFNSNKIGRFIL